MKTFNLAAGVSALSDFGARVAAFFENFTFVYGVEIFLIFLLVFYVSKVLRDNDASKLMLLYWALILVGGYLKYALPYFDERFYAFFVLMLSMFILILFNVEIKKSLWDVHASSKEKLETKWSNNTDVSRETVEYCISEIIRALQNMSKNNVGALVVLSKGNLPKQVLQSGVKLDANISTQLIEGIFFPGAPLHDGAMVIRGRQIQAAGCFLPLTQKGSYPKEFGTRHRAAIGITEVCNVVSLIVSEETGIISVVKQGNVQRYADYDALSAALRDYYWQELPLSDKDKKHKGGL